MHKEYILLNGFWKAKKGFTAGFHVPLNVRLLETPLETNSGYATVTSVRAMCLYLDNHSISTISENELVYLPTGDTDRPNTDKAQPTRLCPSPAAACIVITTSVCHLHYIT